MNYFGLNIVAHRLAVEVKTEFKVVRHSACTKKRRKNWRVQRLVHTRPGCYVAGNTVYMHPDLVAKLPPPSSTGALAPQPQRALP